MFAAAEQRFIRKHQAKWSESHLRHVRRMVDGELVPALGDKSLAAITTRDVRTMLEKITDRGAYTYAADTRTYFRAILRFANSERPHTAQWPDPSVHVQPGEPPEIALGREAHHGSPFDRFAEPAPLPGKPTPLAAMRHRLKTRHGRKLYALRKCTVELGSRSICCASSFVDRIERATGNDRSATGMWARCVCWTRLLRSSGAAVRRCLL